MMSNTLQMSIFGPKTLSAVNLPVISDLGLCIFFNICANPKNRNSGSLKGNMFLAICTEKAIYGVISAHTDSSINEVIPPNIQLPTFVVLFRIALNSEVSATADRTFLFPINP